ncbi:MAG TPA: divergent polysaccharide deacetylase family protein [Smithellaceae bacterium]|nr:divergent polysaccharide deacetylase family protein [Smithellaceae bacterium]
MARKKKKKWTSIAVGVLIVVSVAAILYVLMFRQEPAPSSKISRKPAVPSRPAAPEALPKTEPSKKPGKAPVIVAKIEKRPLPAPSRRVAIIIDDIGYDLQAVRDLLAIDADITFAILPHLANTRKAAEMLHRAGRETLLHMPMEPLTYPKDKPGAGALFTDMNEAELLHQMDENFSGVPYVSGVNNHMGSKFMSDEEKLAVVFRELKKRGLFFIDSRTTRDTKTPQAARRYPLPVASRTVFLDNERDYDKIYRILADAAGPAASSAPVIVIGHPYPETIRALRDASKIFREKGVEVVPVSRLIKNQAGAGSS